MLDELRKLAVFADDAGFDVLRDHRAPLPLGRLRDLGGAAAALCRPGRAHQAHQVLAARPGAAGLGPDPRRRGAGRARPPDQGPALCRVRPRLPGPLGQRARPAISRHRRADGRLRDRQPQPQRLRGDAQGHQEGLDRGDVGLQRRVLQGPLPVRGGHPALAGRRVDPQVRRARRGRRRGRRPQDLRRARALPGPAPAAVPAVLGERERRSATPRSAGIVPWILRRSPARLPAPLPHLPGGRGGERARSSGSARASARSAPCTSATPRRRPSSCCATPTTRASRTTSAASASGRRSAPRRTTRSTRASRTRRCRPRSGRWTACAR